MGRRRSLCGTSPRRALLKAPRPAYLACARSTSALSTQVGKSSGDLRSLKSGPVVELLAIAVLIVVVAVVGLILASPGRRSGPGTDVAVASDTSASATSDPLSGVVATDPPTTAAARVSATTTPAGSPTPSVTDNPINSGGGLVNSGGRSSPPPTTSPGTTPTVTVVPATTPPATVAVTTVPPTPTTTGRKTGSTLPWTIPSTVPRPPRTLPPPPSTIPRPTTTSHT